MSNSEELGQLMKQGMRHLASGVAVVATRDQQGQRYAITVSSITSLTTNPPSLLICLNESSNTNTVLQKVDRFSVNLLSQNQQNVSQCCSMSADTEQRFEIGQWKQHAEDLLPYLEDSLSVFFCQINQRIVYGTHTIIIGDIRSINVDQSDQAPLVYCRGGYHQLS